MLLFIKYISDKYAGQPFAPIQIPPGASFADMVALKGKSDIGDQINKKIVRPLEEANRLRIKADFNDDALLGQGKEKVDKLTNLIGIFESKDLGLLAPPGRWRRHPGRRLRVPGAPLRHAKWQEQGAVLHALLLKVAEAAPTEVAVYGQEKEEVTSGLARTRPSRVP